MQLDAVMARHGMDRMPPQLFYLVCLIEPGFELAVFVCEYREISHNYHVDSTFRVRTNGQYDQLLLVH